MQLCAHGAIQNQFCELHHAPHISWKYCICVSTLWVYTCKFTFIICACLKYIFKIESLWNFNVSSNRSFNICMYVNSIFISLWFSNLLTILAICIVVQHQYFNFDLHKSYIFVFTKFKVLFLIILKFIRFRENNFTKKIVHPDFYRHLLKYFTKRCVFRFFNSIDTLSQ